MLKRQFNNYVNEPSKTMTESAIASLALLELKSLVIEELSTRYAEDPVYFAVIQDLGVTITTHEKEHNTIESVIDLVNLWKNEQLPLSKGKKNQYICEKATIPSGCGFFRKKTTISLVEKIDKFLFSLNVDKSVQLDS